MKPSNRAQAIDRLATTLRFLAWPIACGLLLAIVIVQYNQLAQLSRSSQPPPLARALAAPSFADVIAHASPAVVSINATSVNVGSVERASPDKVNLYLEERASLGSGVIISADGYILTNLHVVDTLFDAFNAQVTLVDGRQTPATVVAWDEGSDLAVLHINMDGLTPIPRGDDSSLRVGDVVFAIGYPRNVGQSVSQGIVSALRRGADGTIERIQTDAAINPGNSGGPLVDGQGRMIGVNSAIASLGSSSTGNIGLGFAIPVNQAMRVANEIIATGKSTRPLLGVEFDRTYSGNGKILGLVKDGAAEKAGIPVNSTIKSIDGILIKSDIDAVVRIRSYAPGSTVSITVELPNRETKTFSVTLGSAPANQ